MILKVGKGTKIRFWKDTWCGDVELARRFPQLFNVAAQKSATVGDLWDQNAGQGGWNLRFMRSFNDWELTLVEELLQILRSQRITLEEDLALWKGGKNGKFDVKDAYGLLTSHSTPLFPKKGIWVENVPSKLAFLRGKLLGGGFLLLIGFKREDDRFLTGVIYVSVWSPVGLSRNCKGGDYQLEGLLNLFEELELRCEVMKELWVTVAKFINRLRTEIPYETSAVVLPEERKLDLLKNLAESSPYSAPQDSRQILPSVVQLLKKYMPRRKTGEETNFTYVECLLYTFHHLAYKAPNATNSLCGYKIVTGQPSDRLGEDFSEYYKDFTERFTIIFCLAFLS
ncbi:Apoptosis inhibitor 5-like protein API5 [Vitis vinifera]|uniref:Apoptosis inhibitor 5-like protein API5 n=1 Tax=Vitis vinifera TaxID=29760 RepID=A0A438IG96_VITVI|nr:Apoptosis inhibitor 5-like protein API5 [Vitis vinifera]